MKLKNILLSTIFVLCVVALRAEDKYEYGVVIYEAPGGAAAKGYKITTNISATLKLVDEGKVSEGSAYNNFIPANKVLNDLGEQGWEVYSVSTGIGGFNFFIKRKK